MELIEKAFNAHEGAPTWEDDPVGRDAAIRWHMRGFHDALAVFREHTAVEGSANLPQNSEHTAPTTDEAEALGGLSELIGEYMPGADGYLDARAIAVGILAQFQLVRRGEADRCQECRETEALKENFHLVMKENSDLRRAALERGEAESDASCDCGHPRVEHDYGVGECYLSGCKCRTWEAATDDHEALVEVMTAATFVDGERRLVGWGPIADAILAAGFRRGAPAVRDPDDGMTDAEAGEAFLRAIDEMRAPTEPAVTDEMVERAASAMWDRWGHPGMFPHAPVHRQNSFRTDARAALEAALSTERDER